MNIEELFTLDEHEAGAEMQVRGKSGKLVDMFLTLVGPDSRTFKNSAIKMRRAMAKGDDAEDARIQAASECIKDWRGFMSDGKTIKFSQKNIMNLFKNAPYILDQADDYFTKRINFTKSKDAN